MTVDLADLSKKLNLDIDEQFEPFCDVITDNVMVETYSLIADGEKKDFGNFCQIEMIDSKPLDIAENQTFLSEFLKRQGWNITDFNFVHSKLFLHMQAEQNIKIDIVWAVEIKSDLDEPPDYMAVAIFFEDNGEGAFDDGPNFNPSHNAHWDEFQCDMGIGPDPYSYLDE
jgi:hypothetical protein